MVSNLFPVPVVATVYEEEVAADLGEVVVMSCMVAGEPIYNVYWKDTNGDRIYTSWHYEVYSLFTVITKTRLFKYTENFTTKK